MKQELTVIYEYPKGIKSQIETILAKQIAFKLFNDPEFKKEIGLTY